MSAFIKCILLKVIFYLHSLCFLLLTGQLTPSSLIHQLALIIRVFIIKCVVKVFQFNVGI